jgi:hypothetical protein
LSHLDRAVRSADYTARQSSTRIKGGCSMKVIVSICAVVFGLTMFTLTPLAVSPAAAAAQQAVTASAPKPVIYEWVYRTKYGYKDEWFRIFKKYQLAILDRQKQLGYVKEYTVYAPSLHTSEDSRWDYRIIIVRASQDTPQDNPKAKLQSSSSQIRQRLPEMRTVVGS